MRVFLKKECGKPGFLLFQALEEPVHPLNRHAKVLPRNSISTPQVSLATGTEHLAVVECQSGLVDEQVEQRVVVEAKLPAV